MGSMMPIWGVTGWKNNGKTTLVTRLIRHFADRGLRVASLKHAHDGFEVDQPGTDSFRHRMAGATQVIVASDHRHALIREGEASLPELLAMLAPADLVLIEGWKHAPHPKIEVCRAAARRPLIADTNPSIRAIAADHPLEHALPVFDLDDVTGIANFIWREAQQ